MESDLLPRIVDMCDRGWTLHEAAAIFLEMRAEEDTGPAHWWLLIEDRVGTLH